MIEDVNEACVMMSEDEKFLNDDFIDEFVLDDLIDDDEDDEKNIEFINDEESNKKNNKQSLLIKQKADLQRLKI